MRNTSSFSSCDVFFTILNIDSLIGLAVQTMALQVVVVVGSVTVDGMDRWRNDTICFTTVDVA